MMNPQGMQSTPSFKSPAVTPSQSRAGSRQQSRAQSRGSGSRPQSRDIAKIDVGHRRSRASTSHLVSTQDEFMVPSSWSHADIDPALNDMYASDDEDDEVERISMSQTGVAQYTDTMPHHTQYNETMMHETKMLGKDQDQGAAQMLTDIGLLKRKAGTPDPNALYSPDAMAMDLGTPDAKDPNAIHASDPNVIHSSPDPDTIYSSPPRQQQQQQHHLSLAERSGEKKLSSNRVGRGSWGLDKSSQHPFLDSLERSAAQVPGATPNPHPQLPTPPRLAGFLACTCGFVSCIC